MTSKKNMADAQTNEVETTLTPLSKCNFHSNQSCN